jgi:hypothetical protein
VIKIHSMPSFEGEVKAIGPHVIRFCGMLKNPSKYERDTSQGKIHHFLHQFLLLYYWMTLLVELL